jgi:hypothetical protein
MFGKYNGFVNKARVSACMYFLVDNYFGQTALFDILQPASAFGLSWLKFIE